MNPDTIVYIGDFGEISQAHFAGKIGVAIHCNSDQCLVRLASESVPGAFDDLWFPNEWVRPVKNKIAEKKMEDTRDYLKQITGDT